MISYRFVGINIQIENLFIRSHDSDLHLELGRCCCCWKTI